MIKTVVSSEPDRVQWTVFTFKVASGSATLAGQAKEGAYSQNPPRLADKTKYGRREQCRATGHRFVAGGMLCNTSFGGKPRRVLSAVWMYILGLHGWLRTSSPRSFLSD
jgi:hypothetical protein